MPKYKMRNGEKRQPFCGSISKTINNGVKIKCKKDFIFEPNEIVNTGDFDLSSWVRSGYLVEIKEHEKDDGSNLNDDIIDEKVEDILMIFSDDVEFDKVDSDEEINKIDESEEDGEEDNEEDSEEDENDYSFDYEETEDGFKCITCGKILKSEKRMITHVKKKHPE